MKYLILLFLAIITPIGFVFAITDEQKADILNSFTNRQYDMIFKSDISSFSEQYEDIFSISKKIDLYDSIYSEVISDRKNVENLNNQLFEKITSLEDSIAELDKDIESTSKKITQINSEVIQIKRNIEINEKTIDTLRTKINENKEILLKYLAYIYKKGNTSYSGTEIDNLKSILLNGENISELINDLYFKGLIQVTGKKLIDNHKKYISELYLKKIDLEDKEIKLKSLRKQSIIQQKILNDKKDFKEQILESSKGQQSYYEEYLDEKIKLENELKIGTLKERIRLNTVRNKILDKYGCDYVDISENTVDVRAMEKNSPKCYSINKMIYSETKLDEITNFTKEKNPFLWPVNPGLGISSYYQDEEYKNELGAEHNAVDIRVPQGTSIYAPMDGYVIYVNKPESRDYSFVVLKHYDGYISVYGHLSEVYVEDYEYVEAGQVFAKSGGEFGTNGAGYVTTGPHLHLEMFKDKEYIDPFQVLDLSYLDVSTLPEKYKKKYYFDFQEKNGFLSNIDDKNTFYLEGNNEIERQKYLISKYAIGGFSDWQMWVDESLNGNIDPSLIMCIGLAESTMGKNMTTAYNIGNVGNNDRGDRKGFETPREGVAAIVSTLNNKYFINIDELYKLSGAGRKKLGDQSCTKEGEFCYATDTNHWHNNVSKCLTHLKTRYIPDNYNFRIIK